MVNFTGATSTPILEGTRIPTAAVLRARFVADTGNQLAVAGARAAGVSTGYVTAADVVKKVEISVGHIGLFPIESGAAFGAGVELASDNQGRAVTAIAGNYVNAISEEAAGAAGEAPRCRVIAPYKI